MGRTIVGEVGVKLCKHPKNHLCTGSCDIDRQLVFGGTQRRTLKRAAVVYAVFVDSGGAYSSGIDAPGNYLDNK